MDSQNASGSNSQTAKATLNDYVKTIILFCLLVLGVVLILWSQFNYQVNFLDSLDTQISKAGQIVAPTKF